MFERERERVKKSNNNFLVFNLFAIIIIGLHKISYEMTSDSRYRALSSILYFSGNIDISFSNKQNRRIVSERGR